MSNQISTQTISFYGSQLITLKVDDVIYTAVKPIVEALGLSWSSQHRKLENSKGKFNCGHITTVAQDGKNREMLCMPIKKLNGWLFSINPNKVRSDLKERLENYQEECFLVLWDYWTTGIARRDEVKNKTEAWRAKMADYKMRSSQKGKALNECKKEKAELEREFAAIQQMDLFLEI
ncbi:hypothetical protein I926_00345 [Pasteurella multocida subsp. multocida OH4807]|nr:hypothetical protein I926_00345 [Pasteurella multocida subsp. multocida OH4807]